jgi:hypothetical protein
MGVVNVELVFADLPLQPVPVRHTHEMQVMVSLLEEGDVGFVLIAHTFHLDQRHLYTAVLDLQVGLVDRHGGATFGCVDVDLHLLEGLHPCGLNLEFDVGLEVLECCGIVPARAGSDNERNAQAGREPMHRLARNCIPFSHTDLA